jgi:NAD-dependent DNA ligase
MEGVMKYNLTDEVKHATSEIVGISSNMVYNGEIRDKDIDFLQVWLDHHKEIRKRWPVSDLYSIVTNIVADGIITDDERKLLYKFLQTISLSLAETDLPIDSRVVSGIFDEGATIEYANKIFIFTGELVFDERQGAMDAVVKRGGVCPKAHTITPKIDYLIVGSLGSENWASGKFGRKIEQAITLRKNAMSNIQIIKEDDFVNSLFITPLLNN